MRLLLVEDDQAYQLAMAAHLQRLNGVERVSVAGDGETAAVSMTRAIHGSSEHVAWLGRLGVPRD